MIPKIIHFCWLSDEPYPEKIQHCIDSWKKVLPDYEIIKWDFNRFSKNDSIWVSEAFEAKKYAFAADYLRFYALYNYGGIYLDSDVEVLQKFDRFLSYPYMLGRENSSGEIEAAVMGAEKHFKPYKRMLDYYKDRHFINHDGSLNCIPLPELMRHILEKEYQYHDISNEHEFINNDKEICLYPYSYFSPINLKTLKLESTDDTVSIHHFAASWKSEKDKERENSWWWKTFIIPLSRLSKMLEGFGGDNYRQLKHSIWTKRLNK